MSLELISTRLWVSLGYEYSGHTSLVLQNTMLSWGNLQWTYCACHTFKASFIERLGISPRRAYWKEIY